MLRAALIDAKGVRLGSVLFLVALQLMLMLRHHRQTSIAREIRALSEPTRVDEKQLDY
jgi:hypothetical protein